METNDVCSVCKGDIEEPGKRLCEKCRSVRTESVRSIRDRHEQAGKCIYCGERDPLDGRKGCQPCMSAKAEKAALRRRKQLAQGKCPICGELTGGKSFCPNCLKQFGERAKQRKESRLSSNLCWYCGDQPMPGKTLCDVCYLKQTSKTHFKTMKKWRELRELFDRQNGQCPYSGRKLSLGIDTELDHKIPKALGGRDDIENLQWVLDLVNRMKWSQLEEDFLKLVSEIHDNRAK